MENQNNQPSPENILKIGSGFWASKVLLTVVSMELFTRLGEKKSILLTLINGLKRQDLNQLLYLH